MIIVIIGKCASGKTTCANYLRETYDFKVYEIGDYVRKQYMLHHEKKKRLLEYVNSVFHEGKLCNFVELAIKESKNQNNSNIVFSGIRTVEEFGRIRNEYHKVFLIRVICSDENRERRYKKKERDSE